MLREERGMSLRNWCRGCGKTFDTFWELMRQGVRGMTFLAKILIAVLSTILFTQIEYGWYGLAPNLGLVVGLVVASFGLGWLRWSDE